MSLFRSVATVGGLTMVSRVTGLAREMLIASFLGAGMVADAFFVAFRFPNLFRSLFAEGAFNAAFVPLFAGKAEIEGAAQARLFAEQAFAVLFCVLLVFVAAIEIAMPLAIWGIAPGFSAVPGKMELAAELSRITFPYLLFISLVSLQSGVLNSMGKFAAAAATPILLNLVSMALLWALVGRTPTAGHAMAWGTLVAGVAQFLWLAVHLHRNGIGLRPTRPRLTPEVKLLLKRIVPGAVGAGVYQVNLLVNTIIASGVANGAVSYLNYADRVSQLPLGVVGFAIGTALLPLLSRQIRAGDVAAAQESQNRAMELGLLLTIPAAIGMGVLALPIIRVLFEHGSFTAADSAAVAPALMAFALGLPAYVLVKVLTPSFFARQDTTTPVKVAGATMVVNLALNLLLMGPLAHVGMALSTASAAWFNVIVLLVLLHRRSFFKADRRLISRGLRLLAAGLVMGAALFFALREMPAGLGRGFEIGLLAALIAGGGLVYGLGVVASGAARLADLKRLGRRKRAEGSPTLD
jgi:putative peptidoglycan lipid II flippase